MIPTIISVVVLAAIVAYFYFSTKSKSSTDVKTSGESSNNIPKTPPSTN